MQNESPQNCLFLPFLQRLFQSIKVLTSIATDPLASTKKYAATISAAGLELPVEVSIERRNDIRFGITTKKRITLRLPYGVSAQVVQTQLARLETWIDEQIAQKPALLGHFTGKSYQSGDMLTVGQRRYILDLQTETRGTHTGRLIGDTIFLRLSESSTAANRNKAIRTLLSRVVAGDFYPEIYRRVLDINDRTVRKTIRSVNLKYNHTNWGSCSTGANVNLSTRLLFAPDQVQDYVILHELAHLVEHNHSDRFWAIVERFMPDYREKERWLKDNRALCDF
jgi:predicted metal-dependent hydrolase